MGGKSTPTEARRAFKIREKARRGKPIPLSDVRWLAKYEERVQPIKVAAISSSDILAGQEGVLALDPMKGTEEGPKVPPAEPLPPVEFPDPPAVPGDGEEKSPVPEGPAPGESQPPPGDPGTPAPRGHRTRQKGPSEEEKQRGNALADTFVDWIRRWNASVTELGGWPLPESLIVSFVVPSARLVATETLGDVELGKTEAGLVCVAAAGCTLGQLEWLKRKKAEKENPAIEVRPVARASSPSSPSSSMPTNGTNGSHVPRGRQRSWEVVASRGGGPDSPLAGSEPMAVTSDKSPF